MTNKIKEFSQLLSNLKQAMNEISNYAKELSKEQSMCDKELMDLQHYTEFLGMGDVEDKEAIAIFKEIQKATTRRREIKDALSQVEYLYGTFSKKIGGVDGVDEVLNNFNVQTALLADRKYKPRIRIDLFEKLHKQGRD